MVLPPPLRLPRVALALVFVLAPVGAPAQDPPAPGDEERASPLAPRRAIDGMRLVAATSTLRFEGAEDRPHRLDAIYLFPDRARWSLRAIGEDAARGARLVRYRSGARCFSLAPGRARSTLLTRHEHDQALLQMELRRAALLWPDGFAWTGEGDERSAPVGEAGTLRAVLAPEAAEGGTRRPVLLSSAYADGEPCERLEDVRWDAEGRWPAGWELWLGTQRVWTEEIETVASRGDYLDCFFLPPDRRGASTRAAAATEHLDLPRRAVRRRALDAPDADLDAAREAAESAAEAWRASLAERDVRVAVRAGLELDAEGRAVALLASIDAPDGVPAEWDATEAPDGPALVRELDAASDVNAAALRALRAALPADGRAGAVELRWNDRDGARLVLALFARQPEEGR